MLTAALAVAQTSSVQASGAASSQTSVSADRSGAQAETHSGANAAGSASHDGKASGNAAASGSSNTSASAGKGSAQLAGGSTINAVLSQSLDVRKNKSGDEVTAKVEQDVKSSVNGTSRVVIPKGSRLVGHVTEAKRRDKHAPKAKAKGEAQASAQGDSALGIVFDKAILKNGQQIALQATIQAVGAAQQALSANTGLAGMTETTSGMASGGATAGGGSAGGGLIGGATSTVGTTTAELGNTAAGVTRTVGGTVDSTVSTAGSVSSSGLGGATNAAGQLTSSAHGVVGLQDLRLDSASSGSAQGSLITSPTRDVRLESGTQMVLRVAGSAQ